MALFDCLPQEIINNIFKMVPINAFSKCKDKKGNYFPIIDQFIKDMYISEEAIINDKNFSQLDYLLRKTIYKSSIEDMIKKLTLSYTQDYMKYVDEYGGVINRSKCIKGKSISLIVFRITTSQPHDSFVVLFDDSCYWHENDEFFGGHSCYWYENDEFFWGHSCENVHEYTHFNSLFNILTQTIYRNRRNKKDGIHYESIEIVKMFFPHGFEITELFDKLFSPPEETILMKYL
jgi:hypothetical protein